ncbi:MAG: hypothetical protein UHD05_05725 [Ruminococcus sp.]|nr:hypothetical protein [Ruminococcus sp.]
MHYEKSLMMKQRKSRDGYTLKILNRKTQKFCRDFDCKNEYINKFIRDTAIDDVDSTTFIYIDNKTQKAICAYSLACSGIVANLSDKLYVYPAVEIKIFALDKEYQHRKFSESKKSVTFGDVFLAYVIDSIGDFTENYCGASRIVLYSVPEYVNFYKRNFFKCFEDFMSPDESIVNQDCVLMFYLF